MDFFRGIPSEIVVKIKMLRMGKDDGGQLKVSRFSEKVEKEISETFAARFIRKLHPLPSAAPSAVISAIRNAAGYLSNCFSLTRGRLTISCSLC